MLRYLAKNKRLSFLRIPKRTFLINLRELNNPNNLKPTRLGAGFGICMFFMMLKEFKK